ncbi:MAG: hypothetical protein JJ916_10530 [Phycisphaerales bacterium]|nr:hypothetical protein [Phycisphaerales bacterium]
MFIATAAVVAVLHFSGGQQPAGPTCQTAPDGAPPQVVDCYDIECKLYRDAWNACSDSDCRAAAAAAYAFAIGECWEGYLQQVSHDSWVTLWYAGDEFGVSYDNSIPVGAHAFLF